MESEKPVPAPRKKFLQNQSAAPPPLPPKPKSLHKHGLKNPTFAADFTNLGFDNESPNVTTSSGNKPHSEENDTFTESINNGDINKHFKAPSPRMKNLQNQWDEVSPLPPRPKLTQNEAGEGCFGRSTNVFTQNLKNQLPEKRENYDEDVYEALSYFEEVALQNKSSELDKPLDYLNAPPLPPKPKYTAKFQAKLSFTIAANISAKKCPDDVKSLEKINSFDLEPKRRQTVDTKDDKLKKPCPAPSFILSKTQSNPSVATVSDATERLIGECKAVGYLDQTDPDSTLKQVKLISGKLATHTLSVHSAGFTKRQEVHVVPKTAFTNEEPEHVCPKTPNVSDEWLLGTSIEFAKVNFIIKDFLEGEQAYVSLLQQTLELSVALRRKGLSDAVYQKFFALLPDVYHFHKNVLYKDLVICNQNPASIASCFIKHASNFRIYVERQLLIPKSSDLSECEELIINEKNLKPQVNVTKGRVAEYIKELQYLKHNCDDDGQQTIGDAIKVVENLYYQLEMVQKLREIEDVNEKFKECGQVYLNHSFKVSVNGNKRQIYLVYLCENLIIFTTLQENNAYKYVDDLPTLQCYCCTTKPKSSVFEIGIKGKKRFTLKAESQAIKKRWCEELKKILRGHQLENV